MIAWGLEWHTLDTYFSFSEVATEPETPEAGLVRLFAEDNGSGISTLCYKNDAGTKICFPTSGSFVTGTGTDNQVAIWNGTTAIDAFNATAGSVFFAGVGGILAQDNAHLFWDGTNNRLGIGSTAPQTALDVLGNITTVARGIRASQFSADIVPANITFAKSRHATIGSHTAVLADDTLGNLGFFGSDGASFGSAQANLLGLAGENWTGAAKGTYLSLRTTPLLSTTVAERFRVGPSGQWGIGGATFGTALDVFTSGGASAAPTWTSPGALTKTDDTNVTLALGGTPATALLRAASLTLGWTGTLAVSRGGTGAGTFTDAGVIIGNGTGALQVTTAGTAGQVLTSNGAGVDPTFQAAAGGTHAILSATHTDTAAAAVSRGSLIYGNSTPAWAELVVGAAGSFLRNDATDVMWSTLILPNAATVNRVVFASASNTYGESADVTYDGTDFAIGSGKRFRMQSQNRIRFLNTTARVYKSANQTIATGTLTTLTFDSEDFDTDALHDNATNNSRITLALTGKYLVYALGQWAAGAGTMRQNLFLLNGSGHFSDVKASVGATAGTDNVTTFMDNFTAGDYLELQVQQDTGLNLDIIGGSAQNSSFGAIYLGE